MNPKITAILIKERDAFKQEADALEKERAQAQAALKAQNYTIRINRLRKAQQEVQDLITAEMQAELDEKVKMEQQYPEWQTFEQAIENLK